MEGFFVVKVTAPLHESKYVGLFVMVLFWGRWAGFLLNVGSDVISIGT